MDPLLVKAEDRFLQPPKDNTEIGIITGTLSAGSDKNYTQNSIRKNIRDTNT